MQQHSYWWDVHKRPSRRRSANRPHHRARSKPRCATRSKRGVGRATLEFDTKQGGYRIAGGSCKESYTVCDISKPFTGNACGATYTHNPTSDQGGTYSFCWEGGGGVVSSSGTYTLSGPEETLTATHSSSAVCAKAGLTRCYTHPPVIGTWTRIDACE